MLAVANPTRSLRQNGSKRIVAVSGRIRIDHCSALAERLRITSIPAILVFKDGREVERLVGFRHEFTLEKHLRKDVSAGS